MHHIVQIAFGNYERTERMSKIRSWLASECDEPLGLRCSSEAGVMVCGVDFRHEGDARAFAQAFDGCLLSAAA